MLFFTKFGLMYGYKKPLNKEGFSGWSHLGSNQGPSDYESDALTTQILDFQTLKNR